MKSSTLALLTIVLICLICCAVAACVVVFAGTWISDQARDLDFGTSLQTGQIAPDFQLETIDGQKISLHEFNGKPVLVNFWAIWCRPCIEEMPIIQERYQQHYPDFVVLAIEESGNSVGLRDYIAESNFSFLVLAGDRSVARQYNIYSYPTSIFIDERGVIKSMVVGSLEGSVLDAELAKIGVGK